MALLSLHEGHDVRPALKGHALENHQKRCSYLRAVPRQLVCLRKVSKARALSKWVSPQFLPSPVTSMPDAPRCIANSVNFFCLCVLPPCPSCVGSHPLAQRSQPATSAAFGDSCGFAPFASGPNSGSLARGEPQNVTTSPCDSVLSLLLHLIFHPT